MVNHRKKTFGFKAVMLSPDTHKRLAELTNHTKMYNDIITELLNSNSNSKIRSEGLKGHRIPSHAPVAPRSKGELQTNG